MGRGYVLRTASRGLSPGDTHVISLPFKETVDADASLGTRDMSDREIQLDANEERAARQRRLRYRSWKRGTKEMDLLMGNFADSLVPTMNDEELDQFEALLLESDPDLYNWYMGKAEPPADNTNPMVARFLAFHYTPEER